MTNFVTRYKQVAIELEIILDTNTVNSTVHQFSSAQERDDWINNYNKNTVYHQNSPASVLNYAVRGDDVLVEQIPVRNENKNNKGVDITATLLKDAPYTVYTYDVVNDVTELIDTHYFSTKEQRDTWMKYYKAGLGRYFDVRTEPIDKSPRPAPKKVEYSYRPQHTAAKTQAAFKSQSHTLSVAPKTTKSQYPSMDPNFGPFKGIVIESERGWGTRLLDTYYFKTRDERDAWIKEYNKDLPPTPDDSYIQAEEGN